MRRYGTLLLVLVLATASLLAAAAYNTATVTNMASLTIVSSNEALLALVPKPAKELGNKDGTAFINESDGRLELNFNLGKGGDEFGLQPGSTYEWMRLFEVVNNSNEYLHWKVEVTGDLAEYVDVQAVPPENFWGDVSHGNGLEPGDDDGVNVRITIAGDQQINLGEVSGEIIVHVSTTPFS